MSAGSFGPDAQRAARANPLRRLYHWVLHWADTRYGTPALALVSFAESSFFPIPPDVLQIALSVGRPRRSFFYAGVSAVASVAGGVLGWVIGAFLWQSTRVFVLGLPGVSASAFEHVQQLYLANAFLAILTAAFTPIPYKVFTVASGVFGVPLETLVAASLIGRSGRFFLVALLIYLFGPAVRSLLDRYLELATLVVTALLFGGYFVSRALM